MDYHALTKKCDGMCDSCECPPAEFECQGEPALCDNPRGCACAPEPTLKPDRTAAWYMDVVWPLLPVPGEFDGMDACDQLRWRSVVRLAIEYVLCGERGTPPSSKTPHCPKGDEPCIRGCKGWECRDGWPDDPALKPDIAALKKRLAEDPGFAAQVTGDRPLRRNVDGVCTRSTCECEREGLGDQCVWLRPSDAELERRTGEPHIDGWPLYSGLPPAA